jgi:hypothetical protein
VRVIDNHEDTKDTKRHEEDWKEKETKSEDRLAADADIQAAI